jgi:hypothetical protein
VACARFPNHIVAYKTGFSAICGRNSRWSELIIPQRPIARVNGTALSRSRGSAFGDKRSPEPRHSLIATDRGQNACLDGFVDAFFNQSAEHLGGPRQLAAIHVSGWACSHRPTARTTPQTSSPAARRGIRPNQPGRGSRSTPDRHQIDTCLADRVADNHPDPMLSVDETASGLASDLDHNFDPPFVRSMVDLLASTRV